jgi:hypothetical protein
VICSIVESALVRIPVTILTMFWKDKAEGAVPVLKKFGASGVGGGNI